MSLQDLASARLESLRIAEALGQAQLDFSPGPARWSPGEVLDHLLLAEALYRGEIARLIDLKRSGQRPYLRRSFAEIDVRPAFVPAAVLPLLELPFTMMTAVVPAGVRDALTQFPLLAIRNPTRATPRARRPAAELRRELRRSFEATRSLVEANRDLDFRELVSDHPLTGATNVLEILRFLAMHERRHHGQISRAAAHPQFPRSNRL